VERLKSVLDESEGIMESGMTLKILLWLNPKHRWIGVLGVKILVVRVKQVVDLECPPSSPYHFGMLFVWPIECEAPSSVWLFFG
jgi:hypothetical protein